MLAKAEKRSSASIKAISRNTVKSFKKWQITKTLGSKKLVKVIVRLAFLESGLLSHQISVLLKI